MRKFDSSYYIIYHGVITTQTYWHVQHKYIWLTHSSNITLWTPIDSVMIENFYMLRFLLFKNHMYWNNFLATFKTVLGVSRPYVAVQFAAMSHTHFMNLLNKTFQFTSTAGIYFRNFNEHCKPYIATYTQQRFFRCIIGSTGQDNHIVLIP